MKKIVLSSLVMLSYLTNNGQTKDTFTLESVLSFDAEGNVYRVTQKYDHVPTSQDSVTFYNESKITISRMIDDYMKSRAPIQAQPIRKPKIKKGK